MTEINDLIERIDEAKEIIKERKPLFRSDDKIMESLNDVSDFLHLIENPKKREYDSEIDKYRDMCRILFNRCRSVMSGNRQVCIFCTMKNECKKMSIT